MTNTIEFNAGRFPNVTIFDESSPKNTTFRDQTRRPVITNLVATKTSNGTGCGTGLGTRYNVTWSANEFVVDSAHDVVIYMTGGGTSPTATATAPASVTNQNITSDENNDGGGSNVTYTLTYELVQTAGSVILQAGSIIGSPNSAIFDIATDCIV
jgi:hypothetical protein